MKRTVPQGTDLWRSATERRQATNADRLRAALAAFRPVFAARERAQREARRLTEGLTLGPVPEGGA